MNTMEVGQKLVDLCRQGKNLECIESLYDPNILSVEAVAMPNMPQEMRGTDAIVGKHKWWEENMTVHSAEVEGPWPHGDQFAVHFKMDVTNKNDGQRRKIDEIALYTVRDGKIVKEQFFYGM